ncbi:MAG: hypothetical protein M3022_06105 [Actinomycetota bacterium]|nr:hypothetical protein [Actinomycetota bacterium]
MALANAVWPDQYGCRKRDCRVWKYPRAPVSVAEHGGQQPLAGVRLLCGVQGALTLDRGRGERGAGDQDHGHGDYCRHLACGESSHEINIGFWLSGLSRGYPDR